MSEQQKPTAAMPTAEPQNGLQCAYCGCCDIRTIETRPGYRFIRRRRECRNCGKRFTTTERAVSSK